MISHSEWLKQLGVESVKGLYELGEDGALGLNRGSLSPAKRDHGV